MFFIVFKCAFYRKHKHQKYKTMLPTESTNTKNTKQCFPQKAQLIKKYLKK